MARKEKYTVDYFPHKVKHGKTLFILEKKWGNDGYAFLFKIFELLGETDHHIINCNEPDTWEYLLAKTCTTDDVAIKILNTMAKLKTIGDELWKYKYIWSDNFMDGVKDAYAKRIAVSVPVKPSIESLRGRKLGHDEETGIINRKVKESKEEKTKEKICAFSLFWEIHPSRNGKKLLKQEALEYFLKKIKDEEVGKVLQAVRNYAVSKAVMDGIGIRDAIRFLKKDYWKEWIIPEAKIKKPTAVLGRI